MNIDNVLVQDIKKEVLVELQQNKGMKAPTLTGGYTSSPGYGIYGSKSSYPLATAERTYQTIKDSVKNEVWAEIQQQQTDQFAKLYGADRTLSDQRIQQLVDARYRDINNIKEEIKKELQAIQGGKAQRSSDPYISEIANSLAWEARRRGVPLEQVMQGLDQRAPADGFSAKLSKMINTGQRRGFIFGAGIGILGYLLLPLIKSNVRPVAVRTIEEGTAIADRARNYFRGYTSENLQQEPPAGFANMCPAQPPGGSPSSPQGMSPPPEGTPASDEGNPPPPEETPPEEGNP